MKAALHHAYGSRRIAPGETECMILVFPNGAHVDASQQAEEAWTFKAQRIGRNGPGPLDEIDLVQVTHGYDFVLGRRVLFAVLIVLRSRCAETVSVRVDLVVPGWTP